MTTRIPSAVAKTQVTLSRTHIMLALPLAGGMAFLAGATDVYGFMQLGGLYVSFMSGNTTMLGMSLGGNGPARSTDIAVLIGMFVIGAAAGQILLHVAGRFRMPAVLFVVSTFLCGPLIIPDRTAFALVLAMGMLNAAMNKVGRASVSLTYVTGALVKFGQGAGNWLMGQRAELSWLLHAPIWASLLAGSCTAATLPHFSGQRPWPLPMVALVLAIGALIQRTDGTDDRCRQ